MTNPTRKQIIDAYDVLENLECTIRWEDIGESEKEAIAFWKNAILAALPPKPKPTMAEVEWNDEEHYLAEAEHPTWGKVIMLGTIRYSGEVTLLIKTGGVIYLPCEPSQSLTPTGRRYTLTEVQVEG